MFSFIRIAFLVVYLHNNRAVANTTKLNLVSNLENNLLSLQIFSMLFGSYLIFFLSVLYSFQHVVPGLVLGTLYGNIALFAILNGTTFLTFIANT